MYKLLNNLFGWDYLYWENSCSSGIARIHVTPDGNTWYYRYKITKLVDQLTQQHINSYNIMFLTCHKIKYGF